MRGLSEIAILVLLVAPGLEGACTYIDHMADIEGGVKTATGDSTSDTSVLFPFASTKTQLDSMCMSTALSTLKVHVMNVITACAGDAKTVIVFGTDGQNVQDALSNLCGTLVTTRDTALTCMAAVTTSTAVKTSQTASLTQIDAFLTSVSTITEDVCSVMTNLKTHVFLPTLSAQCTDAAAYQVWTTFYSDLFDSACPSSAAIFNQPLALLITLVCLTLFMAEALDTYYY